jgi:hypothetical protein
MEIREQIIEEVQRIPDQYLTEFQEIVKDFVEKKSKPSLMERLRQIKIQGPPDFAENFDLYASGEKSLDDYLDKEKKEENAGQNIR